MVGLRDVEKGVLGCRWKWRRLRAAVERRCSFSSHEVLLLEPALAAPQVHKDR